MIIMPHIDGCTIVTEKGFCSVMGHPFDIFEGLFIKRTKSDSQSGYAINQQRP